MAILVEYQDDFISPENEQSMRRYILVRPTGYIRKQTLKFYLAPSPYIKHDELIGLVGADIKNVAALGYVHKFKPELFGLDVHGSIDPPIKSTMSTTEVLAVAQQLPQKNRGLKLITA